MTSPSRIALSTNSYLKILHSYLETKQKCKSLPRILTAIVLHKAVRKVQFPSWELSTGFSSKEDSLKEVQSMLFSNLA